MAGSSDTKTFILNFRAQAKEVSKTFKEIKAQQKELERRDTRRDTQNSKRHRTDEKIRKAERDHTRLMQREDQKQHNARVRYQTQQQKAQQKAQQQQQAQQRAQARQARRGGGAGGAGGGQQANAGRSAFTGGAVGAAVGTMVARAFGFGWNMLVNAAQAGYQQYNQYRSNMGRNAGLGPGRNIQRGVRGAMGVPLGFSSIETAGQVPLMARATGEVGPREMQQAMRATGQGEGEVADIFSTLARAGYDFSGAAPGRKGRVGTQSQGGREFQRMMDLGIASGLKRGRLPEYFQGVQKVMEEQRSMQTGKIDASGIARILTMFGKTGAPGMQGAAGASIAAKLQNAFINPGGGEAGEALVMQAMGFGKPGGSTDWYTAMKRRQQGLTPDNLRALVGEAQRQYGAGREGVAAMSAQTGLSFDQVEKVFEAVSQNRDEDLKKISEESKSLEQQSLDAMKGLGGGLERIATLTERGIDTGRKAAPYIEKLEDWEYQALQWIIQMAKDIHDMYTGFKQSKWWPGGAGNKASEAISEQDRLRDQLMRAHSPQEQQAIMQKLKAADMRARGAAEDAGDTYSMFEGKNEQEAALIQQRLEQANRLRAGKLPKGVTNKMIDKYVRSGYAPDALQLPLQNLDSDDLRDQLIKQGPGIYGSPSKLERVRKKTDGGTVPTTSSPANGNDMDAWRKPPELGQADTGQLPVRLAVYVGSSDARIRPTMAPQGAGTSIVKPSQGVG